ncbi:MAG: iron complex outerrane recepter protein [Gammaproteobacteria bacterium]|nr:iron complex outerrane recepter protein [Gammaproteobacteria bacterium]
MAPQRAASIRQYLLNLRSLSLAVPLVFFLSPGLSRADAAPEAAAEADAPADSGGLAEIVVTAQKRAQLALETPLSVTALDAGALQDRQVRALEDISMVSPGIRSGEQNGVNRLFIRGIGLSSFASGADPSSAFYVDGVYVGRPGFQLTSFYDVDRLEVVRGPQGTLYGRNATGGAVNMITRLPTDTASGYLDATVGNYNLNQEQGALSGPITSDGTLRGRIAFNMLNHAGYGEDAAQHHPVNDANIQSVRGTLQFLPTDKIDIRLIGEYFHENDNNYFTSSFGAYPGNTLAGLQGPSNPLNGNVPAGIERSNSQDAATALPGKTNRREAYAVTGDARIELTDNIHFESITGWRKNARHNASDSEDTSAGLGNTFYNEWSNQVSQEFQLGWHDSKLDAIGGLYYYHEDIGNYVNVPFIQFGPDVVYVQTGAMSINAYAAFAQATYSILPEFRVTGGVRYSSEKREETGEFTGPLAPTVPLSGSKKWPSFTPKLGLEYDLFKGTLVYASATRGFKSGTFNVGQNNPPIDPEKIWAYEAGVKSSLLDHRLEVTGAAFLYDYSNLQVNKIIGIATVTTNAASARNKGLEIAARARVTEHFNVDANATYLAATFSDFHSINPLTNNPGPTGDGDDLAGKMLPGAPRWQGAVGLEYTQPLPGGASLTGRTDYQYTSRIFFSEFNDPILGMGPYGKLNAFLRYDSSGGNWSLTAWGKNITNKLIASSNTLGIGLWGFPIYGAFEPPATYGATFSIKF